MNAQAVELSKDARHDQVTIFLWNDRVDERSSGACEAVCFGEQRIDLTIRQNVENGRPVGGLRQTAEPKASGRFWNQASNPRKKFRKRGELLVDGAVRFESEKAGGATVGGTS